MPEYSKSKKEAVFWIKGMRCASCEIFIEKKLLGFEGIKSVEASLNRSEVIVEYEGQKPTLEKINGLFKNEKYRFFEKAANGDKKINLKEIGMVAAIAVLLMLVFVLIERTGLSALINVNSSSSLVAFFFFGVLAGVSTCAALVGGIILSMAKQWAEVYRKEYSFAGKMQPHFLFNLGRLISYGLFGAVLGFIGDRLKISVSFASALIVVVSALMIFLALDMLGVNVFKKFKIAMPRAITRYVADERHFKGRYMPFLMGAATFFLPCGFTVTVQSLALLSANAIQGGLIMFMFAFGTMPILLTIGLSSAEFLANPRLSARFLKVAGVLVMFFAIYNINSQLNVLGLGSLSDISFKTSNFVNRQDGLPLIKNGKQIVMMDASVSGYNPAYIKVKTGIPIRWEIADTGTSGCTNAIISKELFDGQIFLSPGETSVKEFIIDKPGNYKFSCWMGMVSGIIEAVE